VASEINATSLHSRVRSLSAGSNFAMVIVEEGKVYAIGKNDVGQLGLGYRNDRYACQKSPTHAKRALQKSLYSRERYKLPTLL
jgi:alpha-tubulin suppressor-like RCC1 family protein